MGMRGPVTLLAAWALHDIEEALLFPSTCEALAKKTGIRRLRMDQRQSWIAVWLMGAVVGAACLRGQATGGRSALYRGVVAGLEAHVVTHLAASALSRSYTAGVATALPVMLPGATSARRELRRHGLPLEPRDYLRGAAILLPAALASQAFARSIPGIPNR